MISMSDEASSTKVLYEDDQVTLSRLTIPKQGQQDWSHLLLYTVTMHAGENRFTMPMNASLHRCLDEVEADMMRQEPTAGSALIFTGSGRYFSVGLDLPSYYPKKENISKDCPSTPASTNTPQELFHSTYERLIGRILGFPLLTLAALNGHAVAGGLVLALACDYRIGLARRGLMAMNEILLPSSIPAGMLEVVRVKGGHSPNLLRDILLLGRKWTSQQMHSAGLIDELVSGEATVTDGQEPGSPSLRAQVIKLAIDLAHPLRKAPFLRIIKQILYKDALEALLGPGESFDHFAYALSINKQ